MLGKTLEYERSVLAGLGVLWFESAQVGVERSTYSMYFTRLRVIGLVQYQQVLFFDSTIRFTANCDHFFLGDKVCE